MSISQNFWNWMVEISDDNRWWIYYTPGDYFIEYNRLIETLSESNEQNTLYFEWLIHLLEKTWLSNPDRLNLNAAFLFCLEKLIKESKEQGISEVWGFQVDELRNTYDYTIIKQNKEWRMK